jgi:hypothetical protein
MPATPSKAALFATLALAGTACLAQGGSTELRNLTTGGPLRPGIYGRIEVRGPTPPPVIYSHPVMASRTRIPKGAKPVYLYVPPGQVRKWKKSCAKWSACDQPVLFVRVDNSPSRWGRWRQFRERDEYALHGADER